MPEQFHIQDLWRPALEILILAVMIVPIIITATGLFFFYSKTGLANSYIGIIMAHACTRRYFR